MFHINIKTSLALLVLGLVIGFCSPLLFNGCGNNILSKKENIVAPKDLKKQAEHVESEYQEKITALEKTNNELSRELHAVKSRLSEAKQNVKQRKAKIKRLIDPDSYREKGYPAKDLLAKANLHATSVDSNLMRCDSLAREVTEYIQENAEKDSLYELQASKQDSIIVMKDSIIVAGEQFQQELKSLLNQTVIQQESLLKENTQLRKQFKRQKFKNKLAIIGTMILSGIATNYFINH